MPSPDPVRAPWARLLGVVLAVGLLLAGCGSAPTSTSGFVGGDGTLTVLPVDQRPAAPLIEGTTLDGKPWSSADTNGKVVVYNVWGSWCAPCRAVAPAPPGPVTVRIPRTPPAANRRLAVISLVPCLRWTRTTMPRSGGCCTTTATIRNGGSGATW